MYIKTKLIMSQLLRKNIEAISPLTDEEFAYILSHFEYKKLKKQAFLVQEGTDVRCEYFILKGCLKAFIADDETGKDFIFQFGTEDWWITDREAFFKKTKATHNIDCIEDCEVLGITLANREKLATEIQKYEHFLVMRANFGYISLLKRLQSMIMNDAKERYEQFIKQYPQFHDRIPKSLIASYLGISRETLSRLYR